MERRKFAIPNTMSHTKRDKKDEGTKWEGAYLLKSAIT